ncbi:MAG: hypothetical protein ACI8SJ_001060 [Shewanella sp.]|jgi:uncharacterized protein
MLGLDYFKEVVRLQAKYASKNVIISNDLQTNGTLLTDAWCYFLSKHNFLVGLSIDGPEMYHNAYRKNRAGRGTFKQVMAGIALLHKHKVNFATLTCINKLTSQSPLEIYRFLRDEVRSPQIQFIPIAEPETFRETAPHHWKTEDMPILGSKQAQPGELGSVVTPWSVSSESWGKFLCGVFDEWLTHDIGKVNVQYFEACVATWMGRTNPLCTLGSLCGKGLAMEPNGDVFACDHYVYPEYKIGNIHEKPLEQMAFSAIQQRFGFAKSRTLTKQCQNCDYKFACFGECPKNRFVRSYDGEMGHNYLCQGWHMFFKHIDIYMCQIVSAMGYQVRKPAS